METLCQETGLEMGLEMKELDGEACLQLRPLWEEVFWEDSEAFTSYYFQEKAGNNYGLALVNHEGPVSMLYLSPYSLKLRTGDLFQAEVMDYIVGVATRKEYRKRGYMNVLLRKALYKMHEKKRPFAFLMPADPAIYRPYQFAYIYDKVKYCLEDIAVGEPAGEQEEAQLADFAMELLEARYDVFFERDAAYYHQMAKELAVQNGGIRIFRERKEGQQEAGALTGYLMYSQEEAIAQVQEVILQQEMNRVPGMVFQKKEPVIMARIIDVQAFLQLLRSREEAIEWVLEVRDPLLESNQGIWRCCLWPDRAIVEKLSVESDRAGAADRKDQEAEKGPEGDRSEAADREIREAEKDPEAGRQVQICRAEIQGLTEWAFGHGSAEACFYDLGSGSSREHNLGILAGICHFDRVFINEIV